MACLDAEADVASRLLGVHEAQEALPARVCLRGPPELRLHPRQQRRRRQAQRLLRTARGAALRLVASKGACEALNTVWEG